MFPLLFRLKVLFNPKYPVKTRVGEKSNYENMFQKYYETRKEPKKIIFDCHVIFYHKRYFQLIKKCFDFDPRLPKIIKT